MDEFDTRNRHISHERDPNDTCEIPVTLLISDHQQSHPDRYDSVLLGFYHFRFSVGTLVISEEGKD